MCFTLMGEREKGKNKGSVLLEKGCLRRSEQGGRVAALLRVWPALEMLGTESARQLLRGRSDSALCFELILVSKI